MDGEHDGQLAADLGERVHRPCEKGSVDERGPVQGDEEVGPGLDAEPVRGVALPKAVLERDQGVDHRVADELHPLLPHPLGGEVLDRLLGVEEQMLREMVGDDPVDLLGHRAVEAAQAGFDVADRDPALRGAEGRRQRRVDVAGDEDQIGTLGLEHRVERLDHPRGLLTVAAGADTEQVVGVRDAELVEEDAGHHPVVVLAGVDDGRDASPAGGAAAPRSPAPS